MAAARLAVSQLRGGSPLISCVCLQAEEDQALGGAPQLALPAPPAASGAGAGAARAVAEAGNLAPQVEVVDGVIRVVEASLTVTAQTVAESRVVVEDTQVSPCAWHRTGLKNAKDERMTVARSERDV